MHRLSAAAGFVLGALFSSAAVATDRTAALTLESASITAGADIPTEHTCEGANTSPALRWAGVPDRTKSFVLIMDDPDAPSGTWIHWVVYDLPADTTGLAAAVPRAVTLPSGAAQGLNDFNKIGYGGPCPPPGRSHRYVFKLFALDTRSMLRSGARLPEVESAIRGHVIAEARLVGTYRR